MIYGSYKLYKKWEKHHDKKKAEKEEHEHQQQQLYGQISDPDLDPRYAVRHRSRSPALRMTAQQRHGPIGYGLLGLTWRSTIPTAQAHACLRAAIQCGATVWNGGVFYGTPAHNSLTLLRGYFQEYPEDAAKVVLNVKGCNKPDTLLPDSSREGVMRDVRAAVDMLPPKLKKIDMFEPVRVDKSVSIEETMYALKECVDKGWIGGAALSEASAETIRRANAIVPVVAVECEISLWETSALTNGVAKTCAELGIPIHAYSPLGRGFLTGQIKSPQDIPEGDFRRMLPRYQPQNFEANIQLVREIQWLAHSKGCTPSQIALGWLLAISQWPGMPQIIPIPGSTSPERVRENSKVVELSDQDMQDIKAILQRCEVRGDRYHEFGMRLLDA